MKKISLFLCLVLSIILLTGCGKQTKIENMETMVDTIYKNSKLELPMLDTKKIELSEEFLIQGATGLKSLDDISEIVISNPFVNIVPYSLAVVRLKDTADVEKVKQEMYDNINMHKWVCVSADELYINNSGNVVFVIMSSKDFAKPLYDEFKKYVNNQVGKELYKYNDENEEFDYDE